MPKGIYKRTKKNYWYDHPLSEEHKEKIRIARKGTHHTEKAKQKMSEAHKGQIAWNKGTPHSEEAKQKMSRTRLAIDDRGEKSHHWKGGSRPYWQRLSRKAWEEHHNKKIPKGYLIHHKDENWKNIDPENLELMESKPEHTKYHWQLKRIKKERKRDNAISR